MPQTTLTVNGRYYEIACGEGEEQHLAQLSSVINGHIKELANQVGQVGEARMLLMTALVLADELDEIRQDTASTGSVEELESLNQKVEKLQIGHNEEIGNVADRIEKIAARLESA